MDAKKAAWPLVLGSGAAGAGGIYAHEKQKSNLLYRFTNGVLSVGIPKHCQGSLFGEDHFGFLKPTDSNPSDLDLSVEDFEPSFACLAINLKYASGFGERKGRIEGSWDLYVKNKEGNKGIHMGTDVFNLSDDEDEKVSSKVKVLRRMVYLEKGTDDGAKWTAKKSFEWMDSVDVGESLALKFGDMHPVNVTGLCVDKNDCDMVKEMKHLKGVISGREAEEGDDLKGFNDAVVGPKGISFAEEESSLDKSKLNNIWTTGGGWKDNQIKNAKEFGGPRVLRSGKKGVFSGNDCFKDNHSDLCANGEGIEVT